MAQPQQSQNPAGGIFQYIVKMDGSPEEVRAAQAKLAQATPETALVFATLNVLPEGELKSWLMANPIQFWKKVAQLFTGRKYTSGQYVLGERFIDQIQGGNVGRKQVTDEAVAQAQNMFTVLFGVRISTGEDLDALDFGVNAYYERTGKDDVPVDAVERAVFLKQNFYPISSYNNYPWELLWFERYPLVAPIPGLKEGELYNGPLPGGPDAVNGMIPVSANQILQQYPGGDFNPIDGTIKLLDGSIFDWRKRIIKSAQGGTQNTPLQSVISYAKANPVVAAGAVALVAYALYDIDS